MSAYALLAQSDERIVIDPDIVRPGWGALGFVVLLGVVLALLLWNFTKQLKKVRFDEQPGTDTTSPDAAQSTEPVDEASPAADEPASGRTRSDS